EWCEKLERDPATIERSTGIGAASKTDDVDTLVDAGYSLFTYRSSGPDWELGPVADWIAWRDQHNAGR
ncbi:MAG TPA: hypothetical protein VNE17_13605, partial [Nitrolancea sp.]|nr:hypothetical protein [Nitrolancea sp.]